MKFARRLVAQSSACGMAFSDGDLTVECTESRFGSCSRGGDGGGLANLGMEEAEDLR